MEERCLLSADAVLRWNAIALDAVRVDYAIGLPHAQVGPTRTSRALAIVQAAVYDAVNSIDRSYTPYLVDDTAAAPGSSIEAATAQAAHDTLVALYPTQKAIFDADLAADLAAVPGGAQNPGVTVGQYVASQILAIRQSDQSNVVVPYTPGTQPGQWRPDPLHPAQKPLDPNWGNVTPFVITSASTYVAPPPPSLTSADYTAAFNEVKNYGGDGVNTPTLRTEDETEAGIFWGYDAQPGLCAPPRLYNQVAEVIAVQQHNSEIQNARFFALINLAMADAAIAVWDTKYTYNLWRPVGGIRGADTDGNPDTVADPNWQPLGAPADNGNGTNFTPPFPSYTSGHAGIGAALFKTMANFYGTDKIGFTFVSDEFNSITKDQNGIVRPLRPRHFDSFSQASEENGQSRIWLGIHWSFDKVQGIQEGNSIADYAFAHALRARTPDHFTAVGANAGGNPLVSAFTSSSPTPFMSFLAFNTTFTGGVRVAVGDVNGDGIPDVVTAAGPGGGPHVKVFDGRTGLLLAGPLSSFYAFDPSFTGGVNIAIGDLENNGHADLIVGADAGGGPEIKVFSGLDGHLVSSFYAFPTSFTGGVRVAVGDLNGDGTLEIIAGAGPGGTPQVRVFDLSGTKVSGPLGNFLAFAAGFTGGVTVAAADLTGGGHADLIVGAGAGGGPQVKVLDGITGALLETFYAFDPTFTGGVCVGFVDRNGDGKLDLVLGANTAGGPRVRCLDGATLGQLDNFFGFDPNFHGGVFVAGR